MSVISKPTERPISLASMKAHLRVRHDEEDTYIEGLVDAAVGMIDGPGGIGVALMEQTWRRSFDRIEDVVKLPGAPVKSIAEVGYIDRDGVTQTFAAANYELDANAEPARVWPVNAWPVVKDRPGAIWIDYVLGEAASAAVDATLLQAVRMLVGHWYENREAVIVGTSAASVPIGVDLILRSHRRGVVGA
ncbi:hypothetical protein GQE99_14500 [Maritimibacter sp. DP07]|uniref:Phage gp6-like head-tail connector protein n=1 Tax=Maritimibacter harenae TaxID=2606218 RepID=A0A845M1J4_9RHOB|nr:head-tail connector protein [Maritimibacter harenae]MZR14230.1 hypothetical protein [Maritimibacter harenae]